MCCVLCLPCLSLLCVRVCFVFAVFPRCFVFVLVVVVCSNVGVCCVLCLMCLIVVFAVFVFTTVFVFARSETMSFPLCSTTMFVIAFARFLFLNQLVIVFARRLATKISTDINGYPWMSMDMHRKPWTSMDMQGHP